MRSQAEYSLQLEFVLNANGQARAVNLFRNKV